MQFGRALYLLVWLSAMTSLGSAKDWYLAQVSSGRGSGKIVTDPKPVSFFNEASNWGEAKNQISPGDAVHLVGWISTPLVFQAGGTPERVTTLIFERNAVMSNEVWPKTGAISVFRVDYVTVDGGANGLIENTQNGTNLKNHLESAGIFAQESSFITVQNLTISNMYVRVPGKDSNDFGVGIVERYNGGGAFSHFSVRNNVIHDAYIGISIDYGPGCSSCSVSRNRVYNCNWGGNAGDHGPGASLSDLTVEGNIFSEWTNWDDKTTGAFHHNGFYAWAESGGTLNRVRLCGNLVGPGFSSRQSSSGLFVSGNAQNVLVFNNILRGNNAGDCPADGFIFIWIHDGQSGSAGIYNNTIVSTAHSGVGINVYQGDGALKTAYDIRNNIVTGCATAIARFYSQASTMTTDYNLTYDLSENESYSDSTDSSSRFINFKQWKMRGFEAHGRYIDPVLLPSYFPSQKSPAIGSGDNLSSYFSTDKAGNIRSEAMAIGALEASPPVRRL